MTQDSLITEMAKCQTADEAGHHADFALRQATRWRLTMDAHAIAVTYYRGEMALRNDKRSIEEASATLDAHSEEHCFASELVMQYERNAVRWGKRQNYLVQGGDPTDPFWADDPEAPGVEPVGTPTPLNEAVIEMLALQDEDQLEDPVPGENW